ncbi:hypothetical protein DQ04_02341040 [Trypanosoma grayi]|uniref:hypothetical protein n=1 Tax=Trypanosoma grayi TaxID=71804 RepID=UPI0004F403C1|nr:hypothetical protein DQ04_02341040 [Trypanosoma grayi]KEG11719.1 hypothetical protein DQ04_02341040 [Trypanosoma grayi]
MEAERSSSGGGEAGGTAAAAAAESDEPPNAAESVTCAGHPLCHAAAAATCGASCCLHHSMGGCPHHTVLSSRAVPSPEPPPLHAVVPFIAILPHQCGGVSNYEGLSADNSGVEATAVGSGGPIGISLERFLTRQEMYRTLIFCGVKRHRCPEALQQLWNYLLVLCYNSSFDCSNGSGNCSRGRPVRAAKSGAAERSGPVPDFATVVRYAELRDVLRAGVSSSSSSGSSKEGEAAPPVRLEELVAAAALRDGGSSEQGAAARLPGYTLVVAKHTFDRCIAKLLGHELRGQRITVSPLPRWNVAQGIVQNRRPLVIFCGGTSGCGKSTLSSLITTHLCIDALLSTDTIRQALRRTLRRDEFPELFLSTYEAHRAVPANVPTTGAAAVGLTERSSREVGGEEEAVDPQSVIAAYEKQCEAVLRVLDGMLEKLISRNQAVVVEGVHLLTSYMHRKSAELQARGVICVPFLVCITKEQRHVERFCTRAKCMTLAPKRNKYVSHIRHIRMIQQHLLEQVYEYNVNIVNNTNVDKSLMGIHAQLLDIMDRGAPSSWKGKIPAEVSTAATVMSSLSSLSPPCSGSGGAAGDVAFRMHSPALASMNDVGEEKGRGCSGDAVRRSLADPNISGKRMLALLLLWRSEKKRRRAGNAPSTRPFALMGETRCQCCVATSLLTQATRARSAESLTSFRLQSLSTCSCVGGGNDGSPPAAASRDPAKCIGGWGADHTTVVVDGGHGGGGDDDSSRGELWRPKGTTTTFPRGPQKGIGNLFFRQRSLAMPAASWQEESSVDGTTLARGPPAPIKRPIIITTTSAAATAVATNILPTAVSRRSRTFRSASADAAGSSGDDDEVILWGKKHRRSTKDASFHWRTVCGGRRLAKEDEEGDAECDGDSRCEPASLVGS